MVTDTKMVINEWYQDDDWLSDIKMVINDWYQEADEYQDGD